MGVCVCVKRHTCTGGTGDGDHQQSSSSPVRETGLRPRQTTLSILPEWRRCPATETVAEIGSCAISAGLGLSRC